MPKPTERAAGPSQRALCAAEPICCALVLLPIATPALAEVCDKAVGDSWSPEHGPVWILNPTGIPWELAVLIGGLVLAAVVKSSWPGLIGAAILVLPVALGMADALTPGTEASSIWHAMVREGCISPRTQLMNTGVLAAFAFAYVFLSLRARIRRAKTL